MQHKTTLRPARAAALVLGALLLAACGDSDTSTGATTTTTTAAATPPITISDAWARTSPAAATMGAIYMNVTAASADALTGASVPAGIARKVEIHETTTESSTSSMASATTAAPMSSMHSPTSEDHSHSTMTDDHSTTGSPSMSMRPVDSIELPAGKAVALAPGGYHIMLLDLTAPLKVGTTIDLTLTFSHAPQMVVTVPVRDDAP